MDNKGSFSQPHTDEHFFTRGPGSPEDFNPDISGSINTNVNFTSPSGQEIGNKISGIFSENVMNVLPNSTETAPNNMDSNLGDTSLGNIVSSQMPSSYGTQITSPTSERSYNHTSASELSEDIIREFNGDGNPIKLVNDIINARNHYDEMGRQ